MRGSRTAVPRRAWARAATTLFLTLSSLTLVASCGSGTRAVPERAPALSATFVRGPIANTAEARIHVADGQSVASVAFTVRSKPEHCCREVHVRYARSYLDRVRAIEDSSDTVRIAVFGLYADYLNEVTIEVESLSGESAGVQCLVQTDPLPDAALPTLDVFRIDEDLDLGFLLLQGFGPPAIVDIDGEIRWRAPETTDDVFPRVQTPAGLVAGSLFSNAIYEIDWLGRVTTSALSDSRCFLSHHNIEHGKSGFLNTVSLQDGGVMWPQSVLAEMSSSGVVSKLWDFDELLREHILANGEDPCSLVMEGVDWFHMNSAIYDARDDGVIVSSRENFVAKIDYDTGEIRWLLGNPEKAWFTDFPLSLQPLALTVLGDPPIGQHSLSLSADGSQLMLFDNGKGNLVLDDVGDSRTYSRVSVYRIDEQARTAEETWSFDFGKSIYSPYCSSAHWTAAGQVLVVFSGPDDGSPGRFVVVDEAQRVLFEASLEAGKNTFAYSAEEIRLGQMRIE